MKYAKILIICLAIALLLSAGCSGGDTVTSKKKLSSTVTKSVESKLMEEINAGKLAEVYEDEVTISGREAVNYLIISNAYDHIQDFHLTACDGCEVAEEIRIIPKGYDIISFRILEPGHKTIRIEDSMGNFYAIVELEATRG